MRAASCDTNYHASRGLRYWRMWWKCILMKKRKEADDESPPCSSNSWYILIRYEFKVHLFSLRNSFPISAAAPQLSRTRLNGGSRLIKFFVNRLLGCPKLRRTFLAVMTDFGGITLFCVKVIDIFRSLSWTWFFFWIFKSTESLSFQDCAHPFSLNEVALLFCWV